ncbi:MAG: peptide chain release factor N(5)-glutamine methyltransferase [Clostridia bacterium]|nr:peptide chain release factor N(5)-glutamine methyltransferase [Clostridia bacterium]
MRVNEAERLAAQMLTPFSDEPKTEARYITAHLAGCEPNRLILSQCQIEQSSIEQIVDKRRKGIPLQYILGKWWFYKSEFLVGEGVLVPRQDTETLVEAALELLGEIKNPTVCDLCSGSGCIAISIARERADANVTAVEKYSDANLYLQKNIQHNGANNVRAVQYDVLDKPFGEYDLIVSNPPYIKNSDKKELSKEVLSEPHTALFGGEDGLYFYRKITKIWKSALKPNGVLAFEVGINQDGVVAEILRSNGFINIGFKSDLIGIQRVVFGTVNKV